MASEFPERVQVKTMSINKTLQEPMFKKEKDEEAELRGCVASATFIKKKKKVKREIGHFFLI